MEQVAERKRIKYIRNSSVFSLLPGTVFSYWLSQSMINAFAQGKVLKQYGDTRQGMATSDNNRFLRLWYEVNNKKIGFDCISSQNAIEVRKKWYPYNKGGEFRKWYGNMEYTINYENDGAEVKQYATSLYKTPSRTIKSMTEYFKPCLSWSKVSCGNIAFRFYPQGFVFDVAGCCIFYQNSSMMYLNFGFLNSKVAKEILDAISPTLNYEAGQIASLPIICCVQRANEVENLVKQNVEIEKEDWNSFELSWDFQRHPLI